LGAVFSIDYPASEIMQSFITMNDDLIASSVGDLDIGIEIAYKEVQYRWNRFFHQTLVVMDTVPSWIEIKPHSDYECVAFVPWYPMHCAPV
jgi:hypothetical protein